jgi:hypothetical protein
MNRAVSMSRGTDADSGSQALDYGNQPELALLALISMLSRFPFVRCPRLADSIARHFVYVAGEERLPVLDRETAARLHDEWRLMLAEPTYGSESSLTH